MGNPLQDELSGHTLEVAPRLLGWLLERELPEGIIRGRITETEAYLRNDAASHTFRGMTARNRSMFGPPGHAYVYFTYGMHYCMNVVTQEAGMGEGVLIRSLDIIEGSELALNNRGGRLPLAIGPGRLCQALRIGPELDGHDLASPPLRLLPMPPVDPEESVVGPRIGLSVSQDLPYRFRINP